MKDIYEKLELSVNLAEKRLKNSNLISGMELYNLKKENCIILTKEGYEEIMMKLKELDSLNSKI